MLSEECYKQLRILYLRGLRLKNKLKSLFATSDVKQESWQAKVCIGSKEGCIGQSEDRYVVRENIQNTGVSLFAVFDGHNGTFAADYAKENLVSNLIIKVIEIKDAISVEKWEGIKKHLSTERRKSSTTDDWEMIDSEMLGETDSKEPMTGSREKRPVTEYFDEFETVNYDKLIRDVVLDTDAKFLRIAKENNNMSGSTALIAMLEGRKLIVANVGDSRGVMCDIKGNIIPLSFDHKPHLSEERKPIEQDGGFVKQSKGVSRVAGVLTMSRALGNYPLKEKKLVTAEPDIFTYDLGEHEPWFIILATDGLWNRFSNEEVVSFVKNRFDEPDFGLESLTKMGAYEEDVTAIILKFREPQNSIVSLLYSIYDELRDPMSLAQTEFFDSRF